MRYFHGAARAAGAVLLLMSGCGAAGDDDGGTQSTAGMDRCALLTDGEVERAIGPHGGGSPNGEWGQKGCRWQASTAQTVQDQPTWYDSIEVAMFDGYQLEWGRAQARGEPVSGVVDGALYDESYGELWFECANGLPCVVKARTASSERRQQIASELAVLVLGRAR
jgi:hypothetical protein